jgi:hypothetical protein
MMRREIGQKMYNAQMRRSCCRNNCFFEKNGDKHGRMTNELHLSLADFCVCLTLCFHLSLLLPGHIHHLAPLSKYFNGILINRTRALSRKRAEAGRTNFLFLGAIFHGTKKEFIKDF